MTSLIDAYDLISQAGQIELRLASVSARLSGRAGMVDERQWLEAARRRLAVALDGVDSLLTRVVRLPELAVLKAERGRSVQGAVVGAVTALDESVRLAGGERSPVIEALFRNMKLPLLRRLDREEFEAFCDELEKRIASSYVRRMLADASYGPVAPALDALARAFASFRGVFTATAPDDVEAEALRRELETAASRVDVAYRQARLLAEAALLVDEELLDASGVLDKPRRRATRAARPDTEVETRLGLAPQPPAEVR